MWAAMPQGLVLLVEDDEDMREALADVLLRAGYRVAQASDGVDALELLRTGVEHPRLALVDMVMPIMSGPDLVERLRFEYARMPVVMLSGVEHCEMQIEGVSATVRKPVTGDALLAVIDETLSRDPRTPRRS
jgi:DNA-binding response OmpR family regulator